MFSLKTTRDGYQIRYRDRSIGIIRKQLVRIPLWGGGYAEHEGYVARLDRSQGYRRGAGLTPLVAAHRAWAAQELQIGVVS